MLIQTNGRSGTLSLLALAAIVISGCGGTGMAVGHSPQPGSMFLYPERILLEDGGFATAERGMIFVPANRSDPTSAVIGVEVYRFRASETADPSAPPLFRLFGGPNFQGLEGELSSLGYYETQIKPFLDAADFVVVGQRGIGSSKPTTLCEDPDPVSVDATEGEWIAAQHEAARRCQSFWQEWGLDLSGFTVLEAAADVNDVRLALGYDKIQIWGGSFGSHWGMILMREYPDLVQRAVLRGLEGPDQTYDTPTGVLNALAAIGAAADTAQALRGMIPEGGLLNAFKAVVERLEDKPERVTIQDPETGQPMEVTVDADALRDIAVTPAPEWPARVLALHRGDLSAAARRVVNSRRRPDYRTASFFMLDCGSGITPERDARYQADTAAAYVGVRDWRLRSNCEAWPSDLGNEFRQDFETDIPIVIVHGNWDTSTPLENALELEPYFTNSKLVLVEHGAHGALWQAMDAFPSFKRQIVEFFATGDMTNLPDTVTMPPIEWRLP